MGGVDMYHDPSRSNSRDFDLHYVHYHMTRASDPNPISLSACTCSIYRSCSTEVTDQYTPPPNIRLFDAHAHVT